MKISDYVKIRIYVLSMFFFFLGFLIGDAVYLAHGGFLMDPLYVAFVSTVCGLLVFFYVYFERAELKATLERLRNAGDVESDGEEEDYGGDFLESVGDGGK